jgi:HlyD family secretion protein
VRVVTWRGDDVVKIPLGALFRRDEDWATYEIAGGRARLRVLQIGQRNSQEAQVLGGLDAGARVVMYPPDTLRDGDRVRGKTD